MLDGHLDRQGSSRKNERVIAMVPHVSCLRMVPESVSRCRDL